MATVKQSYEGLIRGARDTLASIEDMLTAAGDGLRIPRENWLVSNEVLVRFVA